MSTTLQFLYEVLWLHGGQIGTIKAAVETREEAETIYALVLAHYGPKCAVEMWEKDKLIRSQGVL